MILDNAGVERLRTELEFITNHREKWDQTTWAEVRHQVETAEEAACNTIGCLAGNACLHNGRVDFVKDHSYGRNAWFLRPVTESGEMSSWWDEARQLFGLTMYQADCLFSSSNTLWQLWRLAEVFSGGHIQVPADVEPQHDDEANELVGRVLSLTIEFDAIGTVSW